MSRFFVIVGIVSLSVCGCQENSTVKPIAPTTTSHKPLRFKQHSGVEDALATGEMVLLKDYLSETGKVLNCWFTFEEVETTKNRYSALQSVTIPSGGVATIKELVKKLQGDLEEVQVTVVKSKGGFTVVRLVETPLVGLAGYPLEKRLTIKFDGTLSDLVVAIEKQIPTVAPEAAIAYPPEILEDTVTKTSIAIEDKSVRDALTEAVPLPKFHRLLWRSTTRNIDTHPETVVSYIYQEDEPAAEK